MEDTRDKAKENARRVVAGLAGAAEGAAEELRDADLGPKTSEAIREFSNVARAAAHEAQDQARSPEMRALTHDVSHAAGTVGEGTRRAAEALMERAESAQEAVQERFDETKAALREATQEAKARGHEVAVAASRARHAPGNIFKELRKALGAWRHGVMQSMGLYVVAGAVATAAFVVLTIGLVSSFNLLLGVPFGTLLVAVAYGLGAWGAYVGAKKARERAAREAEEHVEEARGEVRAVMRPLRRAVSRHRIHENEVSK